MYYKKLGIAIEVNLGYHNYFVEAMSNRSCKIPNLYEITFKLGRHDIGSCQKIDGDVFEIQSEHINNDTAHLIMSKFAEGYFKPFIDRYEYELSCADRGNEIIEKERLGVSFD